MGDVVLVGSDRCGLDDLFLDYGTEAERGRLGLGTGWPRRWTATWRTSGGDVACAARDLGGVAVAGCVPVRRFTWRQRQHHRPGLHGFESLEERSRYGGAVPIPASHPVLFLDVDGVLIPFGGPRQHPVYQPAPEAGASPLLARMNPGHGPRLRALAC